MHWNGIAMVHQELNQCLERNIMDNLFLGRYPVNSAGIVDEGRMKKKLRAFQDGHDSKPDSLCVTCQYPKDKCVRLQKQFPIMQK